MKYRYAAAVFLFLAVPLPALADWVQWSTNPQSKVTFYYDPASIKKTGNLARMTIMFDFDKPEKEGGKLYSSLVELGEYDCKSSRLRVVRSTWHPERMGKGKGTASITRPEPWSEMSEKVEKRAWELACRK